MSYCRWSSNNFSCDLYCYEDVSGGWTTHVAGSRYIGDIPKVDWNMAKENADEWTKQYRAQREFMDKAKREPIGLPYDAQTFNDPTLDEFRARIVMLTEAGYIVPDYVLEQIDEEIAEETERRMKVTVSDIDSSDPRTITIGKVTVPWPFPVVHLLNSSAAKVFGRPVFERKAGKFVKVSYRAFTKISNAKYWIKYRIFPTQYHWIDTGLRQGYYDPMEVLLHGSFACLKRYIEECGGIDELEKWSTELRENPDPNGPGSESPQADNQDEAVHVWKWWTEERPRDQAEYDRLLMILFDDGRTYTVPTENPKLVEWKFKPFEGDDKAMYERFRELEKKIADDEQAMLHRLIDIRQSLWT